MHQSESIRNAVCAKFTSDLVGVNIGNEGRVPHDSPGLADIEVYIPSGTGSDGDSWLSQREDDMIIDCTVKHDNPAKALDDLTEAIEYILFHNRTLGGASDIEYVGFQKPIDDQGSPAVGAKILRYKIKHKVVYPSIPPVGNQHLNTITQNEFLKAVAIAGGDSVQANPPQ